MSQWRQRHWLNVADFADKRTELKITSAFLCTRCTSVYWRPIGLPIHSRLVTCATQGSRRPGWPQRPGGPRGPWAPCGPPGSSSFLKMHYAIPDNNFLKKTHEDMDRHRFPQSSLHANFACRARMQTCMQACMRGLINTACRECEGLSGWIYVGYIASTV